MDCSRSVCELGQWLMCCCAAAAASAQLLNPCRRPRPAEADDDVRGAGQSGGAAPNCGQSPFTPSFSRCSVSYNGVKWESTQRFQTSS